MIRKIKLALHNHFVKYQREQESFTKALKDKNNDDLNK